MLELSGKEDRDQDFHDGTLDGDDGNNTENSMRSVPKFQEPLKEDVSFLCAIRVVGPYEKLEKRNDTK